MEGLAATREPAVKGCTWGTHRLVPPEVTLERTRSMRAVMGITRVANVTGLDTIGLPVVMVTRPNARSLSVSQGKGLTLAAAKASGVMESIEAYHAEHIALPLKLSTYNDLRYSHRFAALDGLPRPSRSGFHENARILWIEGVDRVSGEPMWLPFDLVHTCFTLPFPPGSGAFVMGSSGLSGGNHLVEAESHALAEVIERDATTLFHLGGDEARLARRLDLGTVDDPGSRSVLELFERAEIDVAVWETTTDVGVAAFQCTIVDREPHAERAIVPMTGMGCHPSRGIALSRALTEAAQSRLTLISGARDDIGHLFAGEVPDLERALDFKRTVLREPPARSFLDVPTVEAPTFEEDRAHQIERLAARGIDQVVVVDLTKPIFGIPVVRVVVPGLEPLCHVPGYAPGRRATALLAGRA